VPALRAAGSRAAAAATPVAGRRASGPPPGALAAPGNRYLTSRPGSGSHPRCLLAGTARAPGTDRREVPVKAPRSRQRARPRDRGSHRWCEDQSPRWPESCAWAKQPRPPSSERQRNTPWAPLPHPTRPPPCARRRTRSKTLSLLGAPATTTTTSQTSRPRIARCSRPRLLPPPAENQGRLRPRPGHHLRPPRPAGPAVTTPRPAVQATRIPRTTDHHRPATDVDDHGR